MVTSSRIVLPGSAAPVRVGVVSAVRPSPGIPVSSASPVMTGAPGRPVARVTVLPEIEAALPAASLRARFALTARLKPERSTVKVPFSLTATSTERMPSLKVIVPSVPASSPATV
ncbi:hypothetical protein AEGHOMDF_5822 [Methylobacterium soli]|nr:hypothetical protein AEGHOMDF_5822 [Methylobacterium soli]